MSFPWAKVTRFWKGFPQLVGLSSLEGTRTHPHCILKKIDDLPDVLVAKGGALVALPGEHHLVAELDELAQALVDLLRGGAHGGTILVQRIGLNNWKRSKPLD